MSELSTCWYAMRRWLGNFTYRIELGPGVFLLAGLLALVIALATVSWQTVRGRNGESRWGVEVLLAV